MTDAGGPRDAEQPKGVLLAPDSFKGTVSAPEIVATLAGPFEDAGFEVDRCPLADGGDGTAGALLGALGGRRVEVDAHDPLGTPLRSTFVLLADGERAVVETAAASGLDLLPPAELDAEAASTWGTGELIVAAVRTAPVVLLGIGGSATTDGGQGALEAIAAAGGLGEGRLVCLCDVRIPWELAAPKFGPQKGADAASVARLQARMERFAAALPRDPRGMPMGGGAGGLAGGLWAACGAELVDGASFVLETVGFDARLQRSLAVITGEGRLDETTLEGKVVSDVARRARRAAVPAHAIVGEDASTRGVRRALGLESIRQASTTAELARAATALARDLAAPGR